MTKKYEFTGETKIVFGVTLRRIRALVDFGCIAAGDLGGWIEKEGNLSQVSGNAWVSGDAWVYGDAQVSGDAWVSGNAWVCGGAQVYGDAQVSGDAWVYGDARVCGGAQVSGNARVSGDAWVYGDARVCGGAQVSGNARVYGDAQVSGDAWVYGDARVYGGAQVSGNARVYGNVRVYGDAWVCKTLLLATRSDGYTFAYFQQKGNAPAITAGCRFFTMEEAREHWKNKRCGTPLGDETFAILDFFEASAKVQGIDKPYEGD